MSADPAARGARAAELFAQLAPALFRDLEESGRLPLPQAEARARALEEWEHFALYACVRALVAAGGFDADTGRALDAFHEAVGESWRVHGASEAALERRRAAVAERYAEYGNLGQRESRGGDPAVAKALGLAAARRMTARQEPAAELAELVGSLHEELVEGLTAALEREP